MHLLIDNEFEGNPGRFRDIGLQADTWQAYLGQWQPFGALSFPSLCLNVSKPLGTNEKQCIWLGNTFNEFLGIPYAEPWHEALSRQHDPAMARLFIEHARNRMTPERLTSTYTARTSSHEMFLGCLQGDSKQHCVLYPFRPMHGSIPLPFLTTYHSGSLEGEDISYQQTLHTLARQPGLALFARINEHIAQAHILQLAYVINRGIATKPYEQPAHFSAMIGHFYDTPPPLLENLAERLTKDAKSANSIVDQLTVEPISILPEGQN